MYKLYPTLINSFSDFLHERKSSSGNLLVSFEDLISRINKERREKDTAQVKGIDFENALTTGAGEENFPEKIIEGMREILPKRYKTQVFTSFVVNNVEIYGYMDVVGEGRAIDIKTTNFYEKGKFQNNFQNLYLLGLKAKGIHQLDYLITNFEEIFLESYHLKTYNFNHLLHEIDLFTKFLDKNRHLIIDTKIFGEDKKPKSLPLFPNY